MRRLRLCRHDSCKFKFPTTTAPCHPDSLPKAASTSARQPGAAARNRDEAFFVRLPRRHYYTKYRTYKMPAEIKNLIGHIHGGSRSAGIAFSQHALLPMAKRNYATANIHKSKSRDSAWRFCYFLLCRHYTSECSTVAV